MTDTIADRIRERLKVVGLSPRKASLQATGTPNTIGNIYSGDSQNPRADTLKKLAPVLQTSPEWLLGGNPAHIAPRQAPSGHTPMTDYEAIARDVPVLGTVAGSATSKGAFQITTDPIDYVARPPGLAKARDLYALYVEGDSMEPQFAPGDLVFIAPHKPVRIGDTIVIQEPNTNNGESQAFIKQLVRRTATAIHAHQHNPDSNVEYVNQPGIKMHKVCTVNEMFGV